MGLRGRRGKEAYYHPPASSSVTEQACVPWRFRAVQVRGPRSRRVTRQIRRQYWLSSGWLNSYTPARASRRAPRQLRDMTGRSPRMAGAGLPLVGSGACKAEPHLLQTIWASTWLKVMVTLEGCPSTTYTMSGLSSTAGASSRGGPKRRRVQALCWA